MSSYRHWLLIVLLVLLGGSAGELQGFPALLLSKGASQPKLSEPRVAVVRDGARLVMSFAAKVEAGSKDLAWVLPIGLDVQAKNFNIGDGDIFAAIDRFTAARLVVGRDENPCTAPAAPVVKAPTAEASKAEAGIPPRVGYTYVVAAKEALHFNAGDYEITLLTSAESAQVVRWLSRQGYKVGGAAKGTLTKAALAKQRFAFIRIARPSQDAGGLRPLQLAYESTSESLPLSFGAPSVAADSPVRLYLLNAKGRIDLADVSIARFPAGISLPFRVKDDLGAVYAAILAHSEAGIRPLATLEYAGDADFCEPCVEDPPGVEVLRKLGVFWLKGVAAPKKDVRRTKLAVADPSGLVFISRWRLAYDAKAGGLKNDPKLVETTDRNEFHPRLAADEVSPNAGTSCDGASEYQSRVAERERQATANLVKLTGWDQRRLEQVLGKPQTSDGSWVDGVWK